MNHLGLGYDMADTMEDAIYIRWRMFKTYLHYAGALLNLYLLHDKESANDNNSLIACKKVFQKLCLLEMYLDIVQNFLAILHK
jgi:hypothetical protein